jgi:hypothetical protein
MIGEVVHGTSPSGYQEGPMQNFDKLEAIESVVRKVVREELVGFREQIAYERRGHMSALAELSKQFGLLSTELSAVRDQSAKQEAMAEH